MYRENVNGRDRRLTHQGQGDSIGSPFVLSMATIGHRILWDVSFYVRLFRNLYVRMGKRKFE